MLSFFFFCKEWISECFKEKIDKNRRCVIADLLATTQEQKRSQRALKSDYPTFCKFQEEQELCAKVSTTSHTTCATSCACLIFIF